MVGIHIAILRPHIDDRRQAAREAGREAALEEGHTLYGVGIEGREEAHHMVDIVDGHAIQQHKVLVLAATPDIDARRALRASLHTRQQLQRLEHILLAKECRCRLNLCDGDLNGTHLRAQGSTKASIAIDHHLLDVHIRVEEEVERHIARKLQLPNLRRIAHIGDLEPHTPLGQSERVEAILVGGGAHRAHTVVDGGTQEGLFAGGVHHLATNRIASRLGLEALEAHQQQECQQ